MAEDSHRDSLRFADEQVFPECRQVVLDTVEQHADKEWVEVALSCPHFMSSLIRQRVLANFIDDTEMNSCCNFELEGERILVKYFRP